MADVGKPANRVIVIDTATRRGVVAAVAPDGVLAAADHDRPMAHAERLFGMLDEVLEQANWEASSVDLLAVGMGPGSFTGVRVGMAAAKGVGFSLGIPVVGVISLASMAHAARSQAGAVPVVALLDAKKGEVFAGCYGPDGALMAGPDHLPRGDVEAWLGAAGVARSGLVFVGEVVGELGLVDAHWIRSADCDLPGPGSTAALARADWESCPVDQLDSLEPLYVRPPDITKPAQPPGAANSTARGNSS